MKILALLLIIISPLDAQQKDTCGMCLFPYWGRIVPGVSSEKDVTDIYGQGIHRDSIGDCGERFYTNNRHNFTLQVIFTTECIVSDIELYDSLITPPNASQVELAKMVTEFFESPQDEYVYGNVLRFGDTFADVLRTFGAPNWKRDTRDGTLWIYRSAVTLPQKTGVSITFKLGRVVSVRFWCESP